MSMIILTIENGTLPALEDCSAKNWRKLEKRAKRNTERSNRMPPDDILTVEEPAVLLRIFPKELRRLSRNEKVPALKLSGSRSRSSFFHGDHDPCAPVPDAFGE